jgi:hypothetical protein
MLKWNLNPREELIMRMHTGLQKKRKHIRYRASARFVKDTNILGSHTSGADTS